MGQARAPHDGVILVGDVVFVAGQLGDDQARRPLVVPDSPDLLLKGVAHPQGQPSQAASLSGLHRQFAPVIQQGEHALGGEGGQPGVGDLTGVVPLGCAGQYIARLQRQQRLVAIQHRLCAGMARQPQRYLGAVVRLLGIGADHAGEGAFLPALVQHRLLYQMLIAGEVQQRYRQRQERQCAALAPAPAAAQAERAHGQHQRDGGRRQPPAALGNQSRRQCARAEGEGGDGQCAHMPSPPFDDGHFLYYTKFSARGQQEEPGRRKNGALPLGESSKFIFRALLTGGIVCLIITHRY